MDVPVNCVLHNALIVCPTAQSVLQAQTVDSVDSGTAHGKRPSGCFWEDKDVPSQSWHKMEMQTECRQNCKQNSGAACLNIHGSAWGTVCHHHQPQLYLFPSIIARVRWDLSKALANCSSQKRKQHHKDGGTTRINKRFAVFISLKREDRK